MLLSSSLDLVKYINPNLFYYYLPKPTALSYNCPRRKDQVSFPILTQPVLTLTKALFNLQLISNPQRSNTSFFFFHYESVCVTCFLLLIFFLNLIFSETEPQALPVLIQRNNYSLLGTEGDGHFWVGGLKRMDISGWDSQRPTHLHTREGEQLLSGAHISFILQDTF